MNTYKKFEELLTWADKTTYQVVKANGRQYNGNFLYSLINITERLC